LAICGQNETYILYFLPLSLFKKKRSRADLPFIQCRLILMCILYIEHMQGLKNHKTNMVINSHTSAIKRQLM